MWRRKRHQARKGSRFPSSAHCAAAPRSPFPPGREALWASQQYSRPPTRLLFQPHSARAREPTHFPGCTVPNAPNLRLSRGQGSGMDQPHRLARLGAGSAAPLKIATAHAVCARCDIAPALISLPVPCPAPALPIPFLPSPSHTHTHPAPGCSLFRLITTDGREGKHRQTVFRRRKGFLSVGKGQEDTTKEENGDSVQIGQKRSRFHTHLAETNHAAACFAAPEPSLASSRPIITAHRSRPCSSSFPAALVFGSLPSLERPIFHPDRLRADDFISRQFPTALPRRSEDSFFLVRHCSTRRLKITPPAVLDETKRYTIARVLITRVG